MQSRTNHPSVGSFRVEARHHPGTGYTMCVGQPTVDVELWDDYLRGAATAYTRHGCTAALDVDAVRPGASTTIFTTAVDDEGRIIGGARVSRRVTAAMQSHAVAVEWAGRPGQRELVNAIEDRIAGGLVEVKTAWVDERSPLAADVAAGLARMGLIYMEVCGVDHLLASAAGHVLSRWESGGGRLDLAVPATPYPDERYRTQIMWWDQADIRGRATPGVWRTMCDERDRLLGSADPDRGSAASGSVARPSSWVMVG
ncbi:MAG: hypothetical protein QM662_00180 [Gordonia sp. (in: high G+C Gram-positive bacteria)]